MTAFCVFLGLNAVVCKIKEFTFRPRLCWSSSKVNHRSIASTHQKYTGCLKLAGSFAAYRQLNRLLRLPTIKTFMYKNIWERDSTHFVLKLSNVILDPHEIVVNVDSDHYLQKHLWKILLNTWKNYFPRTFTTFLSSALSTAILFTTGNTMSDRGQPT